MHDPYRHVLSSLKEAREFVQLHEQELRTDESPDAAYLRARAQMQLEGLKRIQEPILCEQKVLLTASESTTLLELLCICARVYDRNYETSR